MTGATTTGRSSQDSVGGHSQERSALAWRDFLPVAVLTALLLAGIWLLPTVQDPPAAQPLLIYSSVLAFALSYVAATVLMGVRGAGILVTLGMILGWTAEQLGVSTGFLFGHYVYTGVLGPRIGLVPVVIPAMWFVFVFFGQCLTSYITWQRPVDGRRAWGEHVFLALLTTGVVTVYDLAADPYMVYGAKAWIMESGGSYFGETARGFVGWMIVGFTISLSFRLLASQTQPLGSGRSLRLAALWPILGYGGFWSFLSLYGVPPATRSVALYAMGTLLLAALCGWWRWLRDPAALALQREGNSEEIGR